MKLYHAECARLEKQRRDEKSADAPVSTGQSQVSPDSLKVPSDRSPARVKNKQQEKTRLLYRPNHVTIKSDSEQQQKKEVSPRPTSNAQSSKSQDVSESRRTDSFEQKKSKSKASHGGIWQWISDAVSNIVDSVKSGLAGIFSMVSRLFGW